MSQPSSNRVTQSDRNEEKNQRELKKTTDESTKATEELRRILHSLRDMRDQRHLPSRITDVPGAPVEHPTGCRNSDNDVDLSTIRHVDKISFVAMDVEYESHDTLMPKPHGLYKRWVKTQTDHSASVVDLQLKSRLYRKRKKTTSRTSRRK